jgi:iron complex outermembrane recepter protein
MLRVGIAPIGCALLCVSWCCQSAQAEELSEREFLTEFPTVLSASRLRQDVTETPQAVTVIDQAMIKASGAREFAELFRLVPGFNVSYVTYVKGVQPLVNYHGLGREFFSRLQVLIDGRSINNATLGGVDWSDLPLALDDVDRIEVIRGPSNATHGIGAFMATINFITKHASQERGASGSISAGSNGILDGDVRLGGVAGSVDYRFTAGHRADDGFPSLQDSRSRDYANARVDWQIGRADTLMLQAGGTTGTNGVGFRGSDDPPRKARIETYYAQLNWEHSVDADNGLSVQAYYYNFNLKDRYLTDPLPEFNNERFLLDDGSTIRRADLEFQQTFSTGPTLRWVWGASAREDRAEAPLLLPQTGRLRVQRLFGHGEWRATDKLLVNAGAMIEHNNLTGSDTEPQVAVNYRFAPNHVVRIGVSKALRTPTLIEEKVQSVVIIGPPGGQGTVTSGSLRPESIISRELSYVGEWPEQHATVDLKLFYDTVHDLIDLVGEQNRFPATAFPRNAVNGDDARQQGIEAQLTWHPAQETSLWVTAAHVETRSADRFDSYSTSAPRNTVHALISHRFAATWEASVAVHAQSAFKASGFSEPQRAFCRVDLRVAKLLTFSKGNGEIALAVENLFNNHYTEYRHDDVAQRRAWLTFSLKL